MQLFHFVRAFPLIILFLVAGCSRPDAGITAKIEAQFAEDALVKDRDITVDTSGGVVTLAGVLQSQAEAMHAIEIARETRGVVNVVDELSVSSGEPQVPTSGHEDR